MSISSTGIPILAARDETVKAIMFFNNKNIRFIPENAAESFPDLVVFRASNCVIESVSKRNFQKLEILQCLHLAGNKITKIDSNTFEDLRLLEKLDLREKWFLIQKLYSLNSIFILGFNRIKYLNGAAFSRLTKLLNVWLDKNDCIEEDFQDPSQISLLPSTVDEKCGFNESAETTVDNELQKPFSEISMTRLNNSKMNDPITAADRDQASKTRQLLVVSGISICLTIAIVSAIYVSITYKLIIINNNNQRYLWT